MALDTVINNHHYKTILWYMPALFGWGVRWDALPPAHASAYASEIHIMKLNHVTQDEKKKREMKQHKQSTHFILSYWLHYYIFFDIWVALFSPNLFVVPLDELLGARCTYPRRVPWAHWLRLREPFDNIALAFLWNPHFDNIAPAFLETPVTCSLLVQPLLCTSAKKDNWIHCYLTVPAY